MLPIENTESDLKNYLITNLKGDKKVALNYKNFNIHLLKSLKDSLSNYNFEIINDDKTIVDSLNGESTAQINPVYVHDIKYTGRSTTHKLNEIRVNFNKYYSNKGILINNFQNYALILNKLDEIAWLTNLRGSDIPNNPVFFAYAILIFTPENQKLFLFIEKKNFFSENNFSKEIELKDYNNFYTELENISYHYNLDIILDKNSCNYAIYQKILSINNSTTSQKTFLIDGNIVEYFKSIKNEIEANGFRNSHRRDGAAIVRYLAWLHNQLVDLNKNITEYDGSEKLLSLRKENNLFVEESFDTISSSGENSAIIHYKPAKNECKSIDPNLVYLLDSGGQYLDGTTDTTRTLIINQYNFKNHRIKELYTRVLLGNLSVEKIIFNANKSLTGSHIDSLARQYLWNISEDYPHGTGHGVGHFLNVHEGPQAINSRSNLPIVGGMVVSNEPGYYLRNNYGIRLENLLLTRENNGFIYFENLTRVHYETNLLYRRLLSEDVIESINRYHETVYNDLIDILHEKKDKIAIDYLKFKTQKI